MVLVKRKPVLYYPLPSLSDVLQPVQPGTAIDSTSSPAPSDPKGKANDHGDEPAPIPPDSKKDDEQLEKLLTVFRGEFEGARGNVGPGKGKKAGTRVKGGASAPNGIKVNGTSGHDTDGEGEASGSGPVSWRIWDRESYFIPQTGEVFIDYESFISRMTFLSQPVFQCEVSGKSNLDYFSAQASEFKEAKQLHSRFPQQLKKAVLTAVQFQIEGKLDTLADKIYERYVNRFFDDECVFVDVEGDKYLARIVKTFPPRSLAASTSSSSLSKFPNPPQHHPYAVDLNISVEEANQKDDPMGYFYNVRLIEEDSGEEDSNGDVKSNGHAIGETDEEQWQGSTMEVQADKISRDRLNFSRAMLKRFIRDCVYRDAAVYSPWLIKPSVATRYGISTEMPEKVRDRIQKFREKQMDKRKRDREERLGITHEEIKEEVEKPKTKKQKQAEEKKAREEEKERERLAKEEEKKKKPQKFPAEDLLVEYSPEKDGPAGRIEVRPAPNRNLPFGDQFETFLMSWSFLNVMGKPLGLSPFTLDDYEQALYHNDPWTSPNRLMIEIHATMLNSLISDQIAENEAAKSLVLNENGRSEENDVDYWEGKKGATAELLRPAATDYARSWKTKLLGVRDNRKGWEGALVGCLWECATLDTLPAYLDNILHLTFEDKPAPTRPTWSTGPATAASGHGLIPTKPEKRYSTLHHVHKLDIISFLIERVAQTTAVRDFLEQSTTELTEVRKDIIEVKRAQRQLRAEKLALDPPKPKEEEPAVDANGDTIMDSGDGVKEENGTPEPSANGHVNGFGSNANGTERDELESSIGRVHDDDDDDDDDKGDDSDSLSDPDTPEDGPNVAAAARRKAMHERALEREADEAMRAAKAAEDRLKAKELKAVALEKKRLQEEIDALSRKLRLLDHDFRSRMFTLRARPMGQDRFGNKVWWLDGLGSAPLLSESGKVTWGTGRLYVQGGEDIDLEFYRGPAEVTVEECEERRKKEEGDARLSPGEWGMYDTPESLAAFVSWLNPKGIRESALLKIINQWLPEMEEGMRKRRLASGLDHTGENEEGAVKRSRPVRTKAAGGDEEGAGFLSWKNRRAA